MRVYEILTPQPVKLGQWRPPSRLDRRRIPTEQLRDQPVPPHDPPINDPANAVRLVKK